MPAVGLAFLFLGYSVTYYGLTQVRGQNYGLLDLVLPGRWVNALRNPPLPDGERIIDPSSVNRTEPASTPTTGTTATLPNPLGEPNPSPGLPMD